MLNNTTKTNKPNTLQVSRQVSLRLMLVFMSFALCVAIAPAKAADGSDCSSQASCQSQPAAGENKQAPVGEIIDEAKKYFDQEPISGDSSQDYGDQCDTPITGG